MEQREPVLSVRDLYVDFDTPTGPVRVIDGVSFDVHPNEVVCIVGESSSGKSVTMLSVIRLLPHAGHIVSGKILFQGRDVTKMSSAERRALRGRDLAMIFQDPMTSLNPVIKIGPQIAEMIRLHSHDLSRVAIRERVLELLEQVQIPKPRARYSAYAHELSGGMRQRVMIALAMAHSPALLIADEPTTALDVTIQAQVLDTLREMREDAGSAMVLITHDLGVVAETADRVAVMYCGRIMEKGTVEQIFNEPRHPYTAGLMRSLLRIDTENESVYAIKGSPPVAANRPSGCPFHTRCALARAECAEVVPDLRTRVPGHEIACHFYEETPAWIAAGLPPKRSAVVGAGS